MPAYVKGEQHDASECLVHLLESIRDGAPAAVAPFVVAEVDTLECEHSKRETATQSTCISMAALDGSVEDCLSHYFHPEQLDAACEADAVAHSTRKRLRVCEWPALLLLALIRHAGAGAHKIELNRTLRPAEQEEEAVRECVVWIIGML